MKPKAHGARVGPGTVGLVFLGVAILLVASLIIVYRVGLTRIRAQEEMANQLLVLGRLDDFLSSMKDSETGQRGYLLTGDELYLQPYSNVRAQMQTNLDGLRRLVLSGDLPKEKVERVAALTQEKLSELEQTIQLRHDKGLDAALSIVRGNRGKAVMDEIRAEVGQMRAVEEKEFIATIDRENRAGDFRTAIFIGAGLLNLLFLRWAFRKISHEVSRRQAALLERPANKKNCSPPRSRA